MAKGKGKPDKPASQLEAAWELYDAGDKVAARAEAERVLQTNPPPEVAAEAQDLISRSGVPRYAFKYVLAAAIVIVLLIVVAIARG